MGRENLLLKMDVIHKCCISYFLNFCEDNGINLPNLKPKHQIFDNKIINEDDEFVIDTCHSGFAIEKDLKEYGKIKLPEYFDDSFKNRLNDCANNLIAKIKKHPEKDIVFQNLPISMSVLSNTYTEPRTGFCSRSTYGFNLASDKNIFMFDYVALIVDRMIVKEWSPEMYKLEEVEV